MRKRKFQRYYTKYIVKSHVIFYSYLVFFILLFLMMTTTLQLEVRSAYPGDFKGKEIVISSTSEIDILNDKIFVYVDKNQEMRVLEVETAKYQEGAMHFFLTEEQDFVKGRVTVEVTCEKCSLFQRIFRKAGGVG